MTREIPLTKGKVALVDDEDYDHLMQWKWHYCGGYAMRKERGRRSDPHPTILMHRAILTTPSGMLTDHINLNKLDNRRCNLRICTAAQNNYNRTPYHTRTATSRFKGVRFDRRLNKWQAFIVLQKGKQTHLGYFIDEINAAEAYDSAARSHFGEFARPNFEN